MGTTYYTYVLAQIRVLNQTLFPLIRKHDAGNRREIKFESRLGKISEGARDADRDDTVDCEKYPLLVGPLNHLILLLELVMILLIPHTS